jgi:hypothetical protein
MIRNIFKKNGSNLAERITIDNDTDLQEAGKNGEFEMGTFLEYFSQFNYHEGLNPTKQRIENLVGRMDALDEDFLNVITRQLYGQGPNIAQYCKDDDLCKAAVPNFRTSEVRVLDKVKLLLPSMLEDFEDFKNDFESLVEAGYKGNFDGKVHEAKPLQKDCDRIINAYGNIKKFMKRVNNELPRGELERYSGFCERVDEGNKELAEVVKLYTSMTFTSPTSVKVFEKKARRNLERYFGAPNDHLYSLNTRLQPWKMFQSELLYIQNNFQKVSKMKENGNSGKLLYLGGHLGKLKCSVGTLELTSGSKDARLMQIVYQK